jgi:alkaline phosphatase
VKRSAPALAVAIAALLVASSARVLRSQDARPAEEPGRRPSVILFIGDGMGISQVTLGRLAAQTLGRPYQLDRFRVMGLSSCRSANYVVTDSAAAATALATGVRTNNQTIGEGVRRERLETLVEVAHREGLATGVVTTTRITHATPACYVAHVDDRHEEAAIASQLVAEAGQGLPDVLIGGGRRLFDAAAQGALQAAGYEVVTDPAKLEAAKGPRLAALLAQSHYPYAIERPAGAPDLTAFTRKAVELLSAKGPFFLMVEGGRIDHACHVHDAPTCAREQLDLDAAVGWALDQAERRDDLLVVVTADHATGDLGITETIRLDDLLKVEASAEALVGRPVDTGDAEQAQAFVDRVKAATGVTLTPDQVRAVWAHGGRYGSPTQLGHIVSSALGVEFYDVDLQETKLTNTHGHDGAMVGVWAMGPGAARFAGTYENLEIARRIAGIMDLPLPGAERPAGSAGRRFF